MAVLYLAQQRKENVHHVLAARAQLLRDAQRTRSISLDQRVRKLVGARLDRGGCERRDSLRRGVAFLAGEHRKLLELPPEPVLVGADEVDQRLGRIAVQAQSEITRLLDNPGAIVGRLGRRIDLPTGSLHRLDEPRRPLLRGETARDQNDDGVRRNGGQRIPEQRRVAVLPALDAVEQHVPAADGQRQGP